MRSDTEGDNLPDMFGGTTYPETDKGNDNPAEYILDSDYDIYTPLQGAPLGWKLQGNPNIWRREILQEDKDQPHFGEVENPRGQEKLKLHTNVDKSNRYTRNYFS